MRICCFGLCALRHNSIVRVRFALVVHVRLMSTKQILIKQTLALMKQVDDEHLFNGTA